VYGGLTLCAATFQSASTSLMVCDSSSARQNGPCGPTTPQRQRLPAVTSLRFSLFRFRSPLLPESRLFSLPAGTEMFHFPAFPPDALCVQAQVPGLSSRWVSPFGHPRITGRLSPSRGFSQTPTSFIGSRCQGIHHVHLVACCCYKMLASTVKFSKYGRSRRTDARLPGRPRWFEGFAVRRSNSTS
jgi:hypothetical protein